MYTFLKKVRRGIKKPPRVIIYRMHQEMNVFIDRILSKSRSKNFTLVQLLKITNHQSLKGLWEYLGNQPYCTNNEGISIAYLNDYLPDESTVILKRAEDALAHRVELLGSGLIDLGSKIDWHRDYKTGFDWPRHYMRDIDYNNPSRPSDVKFPWELSRFHWLLPVGQAFLLTQNERYAQAAKDIILSWIHENPYAHGVNWACTMEVALRILSWTWLFHAFKESEAWQDSHFQEQFLKALYLHADFTARHLEYSDINGNHYTADAAGLVFSGLFWGECIAAKKWQALGWSILCDELPKQVYEDGVDFEGSVPYHRLVLELFFLPALYRQISGLEVPQFYKERLNRMAMFTEAYTQPSGEAPVWGDADDGRALPLGSQLINDHQYLIACVGYFLKDHGLQNAIRGSWSEFLWLFGADAMVNLKKYERTPKVKSCAFSDGGFYILRNSTDHIFIDCGPLGQAGRGGHGHNDCLAFEAVLNGVKLISDCGAYVYTASYEERNLFRSTAYHNTPCIDRQEMNRFIRWDYLWTLHNDATPTVTEWKIDDELDHFAGCHSGYLRLSDPVMINRAITLFHKKHTLTIIDTIDCHDHHEIFYSCAILSMLHFNQHFSETLVVHTNFEVGISFP